MASLQSVFARGHQHRLRLVIKLLEEEARRTRRGRIFNHNHIGQEGTSRVGALECALTICLQ